MYIWGGGTLCTLLGRNRDRAGVPSAEGSQFQLHPSWSAGWTLSGEYLGKFGLEKAILGYLRPF